MLCVAHHPLRGGRTLLPFALLVVCGLGISCQNSEVLTADLPLHLEEHLNDAVVVGSEIPEGLIQPVEWRFDEPQPDWGVVIPQPFPAGIRPAEVRQTDEALQVSLDSSNANRNGRPVGGVFVEVPLWDHRDWDRVMVRARSTGPGNMTLALNFREMADEPGGGPPNPFQTAAGETARLIGDGAVHTYQLQMEPRQALDQPVEKLGLWLIGVAEPGTVEILSISVLPVEASYAEDSFGVTEAERSQHFRRTLFLHTPAKAQYQVRIPPDGRLDTGLGVLRAAPAITFRVTVTPDGSGPDTLLEEDYGDQNAWAQRFVDLSAYSGQVVTLSLEAESEREGSVAFWGAPTLTGPRATDRPNVIFYIIDGAGAEYLSVYGYNRRTTPNLERLASEGALFERAYSNARWTRPSTASFMTSLETSSMGGAKGGFNAVPDNVMIMAQHMHAGDYQTAVFTANPNAGKMSGLERGVDAFQEGWAEFSYGQGISEGRNRSSAYLHEAFWNWRETYPAEPYWVHFQTVDIHGDFPAPAPFRGLFVGSELVKNWREWGDRLSQAEGTYYTGRFENAGVDRVGYFTTLQGMHDEALAHNDYQIGRLVERLKKEGEWENTLLVIAADHSIQAATGFDMAVFMQDTLPPAWNFNAPWFRPSFSRIPLLFVWPGHIKGGQRFSEPVVSMLDALPTILDLAGLPMPEIMQGQSLAPLLLGTGGVEQRPVILDEFNANPETDELRGVIEVIDGRWGASLEIDPRPPTENETGEQDIWSRPVPLLLYDLWNDPYCLRSIHEERPDLVEKYMAFLNEQFEAHQALRQYFTASEEVVLTPEQLEMLRTLGYIR